MTTKQIGEGSDDAMSLEEAMYIVNESIQFLFDQMKSKTGYDPSPLNEAMQVIFEHVNKTKSMEGLT